MTTSLLRRAKIAIWGETCNAVARYHLERRPEDEKELTEFMSAMLTKMLIEARGGRGEE